MVDPVERKPPKRFLEWVRSWDLLGFGEGGSGTCVSVCPHNGVPGRSGTEEEEEDACRRTCRRHTTLHTSSSAAHPHRTAAVPSHKRRVSSPSHAHHMMVTHSLSLCDSMQCVGERESESGSVCVDALHTTSETTGTRKPVSISEGDGCRSHCHCSGHLQLAKSAQRRRSLLQLARL